MASLPKPDATPRPLTASELLALRGTPEFEVEYHRQAEAVIAHDRRNHGADHPPLDWEWLDKVWK